MRPSWHLATRGLARGGGGLFSGWWLLGWGARSILLVAAVAMSTALTVAVAAMTGTVGGSFEQAIGRLTGLADIRVQHRFAERSDVEMLGRVGGWKDVAVATPRLGLGVRAVNLDNNKRFTVEAVGIDPAFDEALHPHHYLSGRGVEKAGELVVDQRVAEELEAEVGDRVRLDVGSGPGLMNRLADALLGKKSQSGGNAGGEVREFELVGVVERPVLLILQRPVAFAEMEDVRAIGRLAGKIDTVFVRLKAGTDVEAFVAEHEGELPAGVEMRTTATTNANVRRGLVGMRLMLLLITGLVLLSAAFIIATSLTTAVTERMRELGVLRCIGASRWQIAKSQLYSGLALSGTGAVIGLPLGMIGGYVVYRQYADILVGGFTPDYLGVGFSFGLAVVTGMTGAVYPAIRASRVRPLEALAARAKRASGVSIWICVVLGFLGVAFAPVVMAMPIGADLAFWIYASVGLPLTFAGYFALTVGVLLVVTKGVGPVLGGVMRVPGTLLDRSVLGTPFRHGFTGGSLMVGLAMLVSIWMGGRSVLSGYFDDLKMPDGFVHSFFSLGEAQVERLRGLESVDTICPTTMFPVELDEATTFGVTGLGPQNTLFVSFEPASFFEMTELEWVQGDAATATQMLAKGDAVLVSKEYLLAHGLGVGDTITLETFTAGGRDQKAFLIAGVITSPGLDVAVQLFGIHQYYADAAVSSVFGTRTDAKKYFNTTATNLVLLKFAQGATGKQVRADILNNVGGVIFGDSGNVRKVVAEMSNKFLRVASVLSIATLLIACFGVSNIVVANLTARRFEYGVLRAMGGGRALLARLVVAETMLLALVAGVCGTALGVQMALVGREFHRRLVGLEYGVMIPWDVVGWGVLTVVGFAVAAALPAILRLVAMKPRELLGAEG